MSEARARPLLASAGCLNVDLVARVPALPGPDGRAMSDGFARVPGGMAGNVGVAAAKASSGLDLELDIEVIAPVGDDDAGRWLSGDLNRHGVGTRWLDRASSAYTTHCIILVPPGGERAIVSEPSRLDPDHAQRALAELGRAGRPGQHLHVDGFHAVKLAPVARAARAVGWSTSMDLDELEAEAYAAATFKALCTAYALVFINRANAERLAGSPRRDDWMAVLGHLAATTNTEVVLTLGAEGARVFSPGEAPLAVAGHRVRAVDSTGAGDCLAGTFIAHRLTGSTAGEALDAANTAAAISTTRPGARAC